MYGDIRRYASQNSLYFENIEILRGGFINFSGREDNWGSHKRTFNFVVDDYTAEKLLRDGFNVKDYRRDEDQPIKHVRVNVNYNSNTPPVVKVYTVNENDEIVSEVEYTEDTVGKLDNQIILSANMYVNPYYKQGNKFKTLYLNALEVKVKEVSFKPYNASDDDSIPF